MLNQLKEKNFVSAVVYIRNNEDTISEFLNVINKFLNDNFLSYEIICVNDASTDNSIQQIKEFTNKEKSTISILNMSYFQGREQSMRAGVDLSIGDFVYEFDTTTISYPKELIKEIYNKCLSGFDIVSACPKSYKQKQVALFYEIFNLYSGAMYKIKKEAFRILSRRAINRVQSMSDSIPFRKAVYASCGLKSNKIEYDTIKDIPDTSKIEKEKQIETGINALILYTNVAYKFAIGIVIFTAICTILTAIYTCYIFTLKIPVKGWTTTMLFLSFGFLATTSLLAILIKYTSLILNIVFKKQKYIIESIEKL